MGEKCSETFLLLYCEKNSDNTKNLVMKGNDMWQKYGTKILPEDMTKISEFLLKHKEVVSLDLCYNEIGDKGLQILIELYLTFPNPLKCLNLMYCDITSTGIASLVHIPHITLKTLRLNGNKFGKKGGQCLAKLLKYTNTIIHLDIGETDQTLSSISYYCKLLRKEYNSELQLQVIDLSRILPGTSYYQYDRDHLSESIGDMLACNNTLIEIHLQKNQFDAHDMELILIGFKKNKTLLMFDVGYNRIADTGIELLANYLKERPQLRGLNVAGNGIGDIGARALSFGLPFSRIRLLDISNNKITDTGMLDILHTMKKPVMMRMLNIWGNNFTHDSNKIIKRMIAAGILDQNYLDVKIYEVDQVLYAAYYPSDHYKHLYYSVMDYGCPTETKIKRIYISNKTDQPRRLVDMNYYPRIPPVTKRLPTAFNKKSEKYHSQDFDHSESTIPKLQYTEMECKTINPCENTECVCDPVKVPYV